MAIGDLRQFSEKKPYYEGDPKVASGGYGVFPEGYFDEDYLDYSRQETPYIGDYDRAESLFDLISKGGGAIYGVGKKTVEAALPVESLRNME